MTSGIPSRTITWPEYGPLASSKKSLQLVGFSLTMSERYMNPVVPQSLGTEYLSSGSYGSPVNFGSMFSSTFGISA